MAIATVKKVNGLRGPGRETVCYVGRPFAGWPGTEWGNPFKPLPGTTGRTGGAE